MFPARLLTLLLTIGLAFGSVNRPRILCDDGDRAALLAKIATMDWAQRSYRAMVSEIDPYVNRHVSDPEWILSRYQMHWKAGFRYTNTTFSSATKKITGYSGNAPWPTIRANDELYTPVSPVSFVTLTLEDLELYNETGLFTRKIKTGGVVSNVSIGLSLNYLNRRINDLAVTAAFVWWLTGQEKYGRFAADVLMLGGYGMGTLNHVTGWSESGMITLQTLNDADYALPFALIYDFLYDYLVASDGRKVTTIHPSPGEAIDYPIGTNAVLQRGFTKLCESYLAYGSGANNWNAVEGMQMVYVALALDDPAKRDLYLGYFLSNSAPRFSPLATMIPSLFNPDMIWKEPAGYNNYPIGNLIPACIAVDRLGIPVFETYPSLYKSSVSLAPYAYPNGFFPGFGDSHGLTTFDLPVIEALLAMAVRKGRVADALQLAAPLRNAMRSGYARQASFGIPGLSQLIQGVPVLPVGSEEDGNVTTARLDYAGVLVQRNGDDPKYGLQCGLYGASPLGAYTHQHVNGLAMEIYGRGFILGPDAGSDQSYTTEKQSNYFTQFAAANTVVVNGNSHSINRNRGDGGLLNNCGTILNPMATMAMEPSPLAAPVSPLHSFVDVFFQDGTNGLGVTGGTVTNTPHVAHQRRVTGIVRTSPVTGFYVDVFRSKWISGEAGIAGNTDLSEKHHDYLYHNLGWDGARSLSFLDEKGEALGLQPTTLPPVADRTPGWFGPGFEYFTDKASTGPVSETVQARFSFEPVTMGLWILGQSNREYLRMAAPISGNAPSAMKSAVSESDVMPCLGIHQEGEAWMRPFLVIYEPFDNGKSSLANVRRFEGISWSNDFVGIAVESKPVSDDLKGRIDRIFNATNFATNWVLSEEGFSFQGTYAVWTENADGFVSAYLGNGFKVARLGSHKIQMVGTSNGSALLARKAGRLFVTSSSATLVVLRHENRSGDVYANLSLYYAVGGILQLAGSGTAVPDASGTGGLVSGTVPPGRDVPLFIGPKGNAGRSIETAFTVAINGKAESSPRLRLWSSDRLSVTVTDAVGARPAAFTFKRNGVALPADALGFEVASPRSFTATLRSLSNLESGAFEATVVNDLGIESARALAIRFEEEGGRATSFPNPFRQGAGATRLQVPVEGSDADVTIRISTIGGAYVLEKTVPSKSGTASLEWTGVDAAGRPVPPGIYLARFQVPKEGRTLESVLKLVVNR